MVKIYRWGQSAGKEHMININDFFWLAGIIDGEGFLTTNTRNGIHKKSNNGEGAKSFITRIGVGNTDVGMIKKISEIYSELGVKFYYTLHNPPKERPLSMQYISINVEGYRSCKKILDVIVDKSGSISKKKQMELMLDYINYRLSIIQERQINGQLKTKINDEDFIKNDMNFIQKLKENKICQVSPSTTKRKASTVLQW
jgi:hypothetical protein